MNAKTKTKIFGIGFHKTGTTSLAVALQHLGYRVTGPNGIGNPNIGREVLSMAFDLVEKYDAFQDNPWPLLYQELDRRFPHSKFILTWRPPRSWIGSVVGHFGYVSTPMRQWIYGVGFPLGHEEVYLERYEEHNRGVLDYFKNRSQDLLVMNITAGDGWEMLCPFLGVEMPRIPFPHANIGKQRSLRKNRLSKFFLKICRLSRLGSIQPG